MRRLAVVAHYDPAGLAAPHVLRLLEQLGDFVDDVVVVTTSALTPEACVALESRSEIRHRENVGQDFAGWQQVLAERLKPGRYDEVLLTNDTYVGLLRPLGHIFAAMRDQQVEFWGTHESWRVARHLQSFFLVFREPVLRSRAFGEFWRRMRPAVTRYEAIHRQEVGVSQHLLAAGFELGGYFKPTEREIAVGAERELWWKAQLLALDERQGQLGWRTIRTGEPVNPAIAYADSALDDGRMPLVKLDTLRYDPYFLGSDHLLTLCEQRFPEQFDGVRAYLERTRFAYPARNGENNGSAQLGPEQQRTIGYHAPAHDSRDPRP
jgi:hypothetical protein